MGVLAGRPPRCAWYCGGERVQLASQRQLNDLLSQACDDAYRLTPHWRNELVNRRSLSSSAAAARRNLIEAMFENPTQEYLGFEGNPPEREHVRDAAAGSRLHRKQGGEFGFLPPDAKAEAARARRCGRPSTDSLADTDTGRQSVEKLFALLPAASLRPEGRRVAGAAGRRAGPRPFASGALRGRLVRTPAECRGVRADFALAR